MLQPWNGPLALRGAMKAHLHLVSPSGGSTLSPYSCKDGQDESQRTGNGRDLERRRVAPLADQT